MADVEGARCAMLALAERAQRGEDDAELEAKLAASIKEFYALATGSEHPLFGQDARFCPDAEVVGGVKRAHADLAVAVGAEGEFVISRDSKSLFPIQFNHADDATATSYSADRVRVKVEQTPQGARVDITCHLGDKASATIAADAGIDHVLKDPATNTGQKILKVAHALRTDPAFRKRELKAHGSQRCARAWLSTRVHIARQLLWLSEYF